MYPEGKMPSGFCFLSRLFNREHHLVYGRHSVLFRQLEHIVDASGLSPMSVNSNWDAILIFENIYSENRFVLIVCLQNDVLR